MQFLAENILLTFFAMILGLVLAYTFFIPGFERLWTFDMDFQWSDPNLWIYLPLLLLFTSVASGIYPSLYISRFQVVNILKGSVAFGRRSVLTKVLLGFQLIIASIFITTSIMFTQNTDYLMHRKWGYNQNDALYARVPDGAAYDKLEALMIQHPDVVSAAGSKDHIGRTNSKTVLHFPDKELEVDQLAVDAPYLSTLEIPLKDGRWFRDAEGSDRQAVVVNELLVSSMKWTNAVGQQFRIDSVQYEVIGVVKDFHNYSFSSQVRPIIFTRADNKDFQYLTLRVNAGTDIEVYKALQANWSKLYPEVPFDGNLQEDVWGFYYEQIKIYDLVWKVFATIAISLCLLGLYGMVKLNIEGRSKEFSIRKVLGAGIASITATVTKQYVVLFVLALGAGTPLGYLFSKWIFSNDPVHMPLTYSGAAIASAILIIALMSTIATQIGRIVKADPVDGLKVE